MITIPAIAADGALYEVEKMAAHRAGLLHLAISVFVFDGDALLIQRRALAKYHCGGLTEHERVHLFRGAADAATLLPDPDPAEVAETRWVTAAALEAEVAANPAAFTPWFRIYLARWPGFSFGAAA